MGRNYHRQRRDYRDHGRDNRDLRQKLLGHHQSNSFHIDLPLTVLKLNRAAMGGDRLD